MAETSADKLSSKAHAASNAANDTHEKKVSKNPDPQANDLRAAAKAHQDAADAHKSAADAHYDNSVNQKGDASTHEWFKGSQHRQMADSHNQQAKDCASRADQS